MTSDDLAELSLVEIADEIASRHVSSLEVTEACIARIEQAQPTLNAFLSLDADGALTKARAADAALARGGARGPLHGVPLAHKDLYYREGVTATCGSKILRDYRPRVTATALERLEAAGALHLGSLHMAEFALGPTGHNDHFGPAHNPWRPAHITGGSSSGSGAAVAARLIFGALGSDTGGSIRLPAAYCGITGIKPTNGLISRAGAMPLSQSLDCVGPLARTVQDCARLLQAIAGHDRRDTTSARRPVPDYEALLERPVAGRRIGVILDGSMFRYMPEDVQSQYVTGVQAWREAGCELIEIALPELDAITTAAAVVMRAETAAFHARWLKERPGDYGAQVRIRLEPGLFIPAVQYLEALRLRGPLLKEFCEQVFARCDALVAPVINTPAPAIAETEAHDPEAVAERVLPVAHCTRPINYLGLPSLALPCGFIKGLPFAFQLIGRPFSEALLFNLGHTYQAVTGWHRRVPLLPQAGGS